MNHAIHSAVIVINAALLPPVVLGSASKVVVTTIERFLFTTEGIRNYVEAQLGELSDTEDSSGYAKLRLRRTASNKSHLCSDPAQVA